jgi:hypothetical protein
LNRSKREDAAARHCTLGGGDGGVAGRNNFKAVGFVLPGWFTPGRTPLSRRQKLARNEFVLEIDGRAVLAFMSRDLECARQFCAEPWFVTELASYRACGLPLWDGTSRLSVRRANTRESATLQVALHLELSRDEYEGQVFAFLTGIDPLPH